MIFDDCFKKEWLSNGAGVGKWIVGVVILAIEAEQFKAVAINVSPFFA